MMLSYIRSECDNVPNQKCRMVPRQVCQPGCSTSNTCNKCESFRNQGGFSSCSTGTCPNYFPEDPFIGGSYGQGSQGYNPGNMGGCSTGGCREGGQGYTGGQGYQPGGGGGGYGGSDDQWGYNPGNNNLVVVGDPTTRDDGSHGWDSPGEDWYNPGKGGLGEAGFSPENSGGNIGGGFNPGQNFYPVTPGAQGYNPMGGGNLGYNPRLRGSPVDENKSLLSESKDPVMS